MLFSFRVKGKSTELICIPNLHNNKEKILQKKNKNISNFDEFWICVDCKIKKLRDTRFFYKFIYNLYIFIYIYIYIFIYILYI